MAFFRIQKHMLLDPATMAALNRSFTSLVEIHPLAGGEHPNFKWFQVTGNGIPPEAGTEIELLFERAVGTPNHVTIKWLKKEIM